MRVERARITSGFAALTGLFLVAVAVAHFAPPFLGVLSTGAGVVASLYLCSVPGLVLLGALGVDVPNPSKRLVYSIATSLFLLAALGLALSVLLPPLGVDRPLSARIVLVAVLLLMGGLLSVFARHGPEYVTIHVDERHRRLRRQHVGFAFLPVVAAVGARLVTTQGSAVVAIVGVGLAATVPLLVWTGAVEEHDYPIALFSVSLALILHATLVTNYVFGYDIQHTYHYAHLVKSNAVWHSNLVSFTDWEPTILGQHRALLVLVVVPAAVSELGHISLHTFYKVVFSVLFAFIAVVIYYLYRDGFDASVAVYGSLLYAFNSSFYSRIIGKQPMGTLFMSLLLLVAIQDDRLSRESKAGLLVVFAVLMVLSHYGVTVLFLASAVGAYAIVRFRERTLDSPLVRPTFVFFLGAFMFGWYAYTAQGSILLRLSYVINTVVEQLQTLFVIEPESKSGAALVAESTTSRFSMNKVRLYLHLFIMGLMGVGIVGSVVAYLYRRTTSENVTYFAFALMFFGISMAGFFVSGQLGGPRAFFLSSILLAPYAVVAYSRFSVFTDALTGYRVPIPDRTYTFAFSVILVGFLLLNTGTAHVLVQDQVENPIALPIHADLDYAQYNSREVAGARWLGTYASDGVLACAADDYGTLVLWEFFRYRCNVFEADIDRPRYTYLRSKNVDGLIMTRPSYGGINRYSSFDDPEIASYFRYRDKIYTNGGSEIFA